MARFEIVTESTCDLTAQLIRELDVRVIPMEFTVEGRAFSDNVFDRKLEPPEFYNLLREGKTASTAQVNSTTYLDLIEPLLKQGKDVLILAFSSQLSGTYQSSVMAVQQLKEQYPERKIITIDTKSASMGEGLVVYYAAKLRDSGRSIDEVAEWVTENRLKVCHWFTVDDLNHLKRGGRLTATKAIVGTFLGIKPVLHVDDEGKLKPVGKVRGRRQSLDALIENMKKTYIDTEPQTVFISHADCIEDAEYLEKQVKANFKPERVIINYIGPVIGAHAGPGTVAVFFLGKHR
ncbi:MAG TPA: DegV family protein [Clostridiales bacterium]|nr:DegV family protein [Clostridiales bacterium]